MSNVRGGMNISFGIRQKTPQQLNISMPTTIFPVIDVNQVAQRINLIQEARASGEKNIPSTDQKSRFGTREMDIDTEIQRVVSGYHSTAANRVQQLDGQIVAEALKTRSKIAEIRCLPESFKGEVDKELNASKNDFDISKKEYELAKKEYDKFRSDNHLERTANIVQNRIFPIFVMIFLIICEGLANTSFFADLTDGGLIGAFTIAFLASGFNVVFSGIISFFGIRQINHIKRRAIGWISLFVWIGILVNFAFVIGHFRDAKGTTFLPSTGDWLLLQDPLSWLLFAVTLLFGLVAARESYKLDDPYPGYSAVTRKFQDAEDDLADLIEERNRQLTKTFNKHKESVNAGIQTVGNGVACVRRYITDKQNTLMAYQKALRSVQKPFETLIGMFRQENCMARNDKPPAYFMEETHLDLSSLPAIVATSDCDDDRLIQQLSAEAAQLRSDVGKIHSQITETFNKYMSSVQSGSMK